MKQIITFILTFLFGERAEGIKLTSPTFSTLEPLNRPSEDDWAREFKFGSRYGYRGSFYQYR